MAHEPIPLDAIEPLLRGGWRGARAAWSVLAEHPEPLRAAVKKVWQMLPVRSAEALEDLTQQVYLSIVERASRHEGLPRPEGWGGRADAFPWLFKVALTHAQDASRKVRRVASAEVTAEREDGTTRPEAEGRSTSDPEGELLRGQAGERLRAVLAKPDVKPAHKLMIALKFFPDELDEALIRKVAGASDAATGAGLARSPEETAARLRAWVDDPPRDEVRANRALAWILRSTDQTDPETWRRACPDDMARALDLVRQWRNRALKHVEGLE